MWEVLCFKTRLIVHTLTVFDMQSQSSFCFLWHEAVGGVTATNYYASILLIFFRENRILITDRLENDQQGIILWNGGCISQDRNCTSFNALVNIAMK